MNSFHDSHPLKKLMTAVERLCDKNYLLTQANSPLTIRITPPHSSVSHPELATVIEEESDALFSEGPAHEVVEQFPLISQMQTSPIILNTSQDTLKSLNDIIDLINDPKLLKEVALNPNYYYEEYKALTVYLEFFFGNKNENESFSETQRNASGSPKSEKLWESKHKNELENIVFLKALFTTYFFHMLMEKVYIGFLGINYDPAVIRLDKNAAVLFEMMGTHLSPNIWLHIQHQEVPRIFSCKEHTKEPTHPFSFLAEIDQRAMQINFKRLFLIRFRRFYLSLSACLIGLSALPVFAFMEHWLPIIIGLGNIVYFLPRIVSDLLNLFYQVFILKPKTVESNWLELFKIHFNRRFDVFFRDVLLFTNALLSFFVLTGTLGGWALLVNMLFQWAEMILNLIILNATKNHFNLMPEMLAHFGLPRAHPKMVVIEKELTRRLDIDFRISYMRTCNSIVISLTSAMILPFFNNLSVFIPLAGSIIALIMSYWQYYQLKEGLKNRSSIPDRMFSPEMPAVNRFVSSANLVLN